MLFVALAGCAVRSSGQSDRCCSEGVEGEGLLAGEVSLQGCSLVGAPVGPQVVKRPLRTKASVILSFRWSQHTARPTGGGSPEPKSSHVQTCQYFTPLNLLQLDGCERSLV